MGKIFRYEGAANSQNLANFGNRTTCEIRCRFDQRIRQFFVRWITTEIRFAKYFRILLCELAANSQKDSLYTLRVALDKPLQKALRIRIQFATRTSEFVSTSERNENRLKVFGPPSVHGASVHRRREVTDWIGAPSLLVRLRNELIIKFAERIRYEFAPEFVSKWERN